MKRYLFIVAVPVFSLIGLTAYWKDTDAVAAHSSKREQLQKNLHSPADLPRSTVPLPTTTPTRASSGASPSESSPPRAAGEWQGMLVDRTVQPPCGNSNHCGLGKACVDGKCQGCIHDAQCLSGELCVLDHCVPSGKVRCRTRRDCGTDEFCTLSGYSADPRGTSDTTATCVANSGGRTEPERTEPIEVAFDAPPSPSQKLIDEAVTARDAILQAQ